VYCSLSRLIKPVTFVLLTYYYCTDRPPEFSLPSTAPSVLNTLDSYNVNSCLFTVFKSRLNTFLFRQTYFLLVNMIFPARHRSSDLMTHYKWDYYYYYYYFWPTSTKPQAWILRKSYNGCIIIIIIIIIRIDWLINWLIDWLIGLLKHVTNVAYMQCTQR